MGARRAEGGDLSLAGTGAVRDGQCCQEVSIFCLFAHSTVQTLLAKMPTRITRSRRSYRGTVQQYDRSQRCQLDTGVQSFAGRFFELPCFKAHDPASKRFHTLIVLVPRSVITYIFALAAVCC